MSAPSAVVRPAPAVADRVSALLDTFRDRLYDPRRRSLRVFLDFDWRELGDVRSFGHDIKASWLIDEACGEIGADLPDAVVDLARGTAERSPALNGVGFRTNGLTSARPGARRWRACWPGSGTGARHGRRATMDSVVRNLSPAEGTDVLLGPAAEDSAPPADMGAGRGPRWLDDWLAANLTRVLSWRRALHACPELMHEEFRTTETIVGVLRSFGLVPRVLPVGTGVVCEVGSGPRCVALRADIDALAVAEYSDSPFASRVPGVSHACGHDVHTAVLLGAAGALASAPELPGRVRLLFQPAEEKPGGAHDVIAGGGIDGVERIFGLHCDPKVEVGRIGTRAGPVTSACDLLELHVEASGSDGLGADVVHALGVMATGLPAMLARRVDPCSATVLTWGLMEAPETSCGTPREGFLRGTLRTRDPVVYAQLTDLVAEIGGSLLRPIGVRFELRHRRTLPVVDNDPDSTVVLQTAIAAALGPQAVTSTTQSSGGEDFGWYLEYVPGAYARLGTWSGDGPQGDLHQPTFRVDERALPVGVRAMVHIALTALPTP